MYICPMDKNFTEQPPIESPNRFLLLPLWILAIYALGYLMNVTAPIFLWIVCAFFLFVLLDPVAEFLKARRWPTLVSSIVLISVATVIGLSLIYVLALLFSNILVELDQSKRLFFKSFESLNAILNNWALKIPGFHSLPASGQTEVSKVEIVHGSPLSSDLSGTILSGLGSAVTILTFSLLVPILSFFLLIERDALSKAMARVQKQSGIGALIWKRIVSATQAFFVGNLFLGAITFPVFLMLFWLFSVPSLLTVAALATFLNLIPFAGAVLAGFFPALTLYGQGQSLSAAFGVYGVSLGVHFIVADFITPKILGSRVNINATASTIALVAWGELWGGLGLVLAIPLTAVLKILFEHSSQFWLQWIAALMSDDIDSALKRSRFLKSLPGVFKYKRTDG
jgi:predicted PurR-regulated permease PerM